MGFRTVEITGPAEIHVRSGSLVVEKKIKQNNVQKDSQLSVTKKRSRKEKEPELQKVYIPLDDINTITCMGAGLRVSTMAMAQFCEHKISMTILDEKYRPAGFLTAYEANARQSMTMRRQVYMEKDRADRLWEMIIIAKIMNQAEAVNILGLPKAENVRRFADLLTHSPYTDYLEGAPGIDAVEAGAAREYFSQLCPDMVRRQESPVNSRLNYGYSVIRNSLIRAIVASGLLPSFGIHHQNLYNAYNLADDLIEPFRPCVDIIAFEMRGVDLQLSRKERKQLASVLQSAVSTGGQKMSVLQAIDKVVSEYRNYVMEECDMIDLPSVLPLEILRQVIE